MFVGVAVQPGIIADISIESDNSELEEITVQIYEVDRTYNHTVMLTPEQVKELENLINNFENELDSTDNPVETETIYKNTVVSLNEFGLLPEGMSVDEAQRLVTGEEQDPRIVKVFERWYSRNQKSLDNNENFLCLISGATNYTIFQGLTGRFVFIFIESFMELLEKMFYNYPNLYFLFLDIIRAPLFGFILLSSLFWNINPLSIGYEIGLGFWTSPMWLPPHDTPAEGWVKTFGLNGKKIWEGAFFGHLPISSFYSLLVFECYPGVLGFTGIKIGLFKTNFYMGSALWVKIGEEPP